MEADKDYPDAAASSQPNHIANMAPKPPNEGDPTNVSYSTIKGYWVYEEPESGSFYQYDLAEKKWTEFDLDDEKIDSETDEIEPEKDGDASSKTDKISASETRKRARREAAEERAAKKAALTADKPTQKAVYVSGLPDYASDEDLVELFQKYGVLAEDLNTGKKKARVYVDENGKAKGDGLVVFFKPESVKLAVDMLHNTQVYVGAGQTMVNIKVEPAKFTKAEDGDKDANSKSSTAPIAPSNSDKIRAKRKYQKMQDRVADWAEDDEIQARKVAAEAAKAAKTAKRLERTVILKHVFTLKELQEDPEAENDIKEDMYSGCEQVGTVAEVVIYNAEPEGVVSVRFDTPEDAQACVEKMNGRFFGGQKLTAQVFDTEQHFRRNMGANDDEDKRRDRW